MDDDLTTTLVELSCPVAAKDKKPNAVSAFEGFLAGQKKPFGVDGYIVKKEDLSSDAEWVEWFAQHPTESEAFVAVFLVRQEDKAYFDELWAQWLREKEEANQPP